jgi:hypothetical protein
MGRWTSEQRDAGRPWRARDAAEILAMLDMTAWISVLGLLDECPVLPAALTASAIRDTHRRGRSHRSQGRPPTLPR